MLVIGQSLLKKRPVFGGACDDKARRRVFDDVYSLYRRFPSQKIRATTGSSAYVD